MHNIRYTPVSRRTCEDRRREIITAARVLFAQRGFHGTGMAQIARVSGVLVGQIYRDFACKEDLIAAIVERDLSELLDDAALVFINDNGAKELNSWVRRFIRRTLDYETRSILANILSQATLSARYSDVLKQAYAHLRERLLHAARVWAPEPQKDALRQRTVDLILTVAGGAHHRQIIGLPRDEALEVRVLEIVDAEITSLECS